MSRQKDLAVYRLADRTTSSGALLDHGTSHLACFRPVACEGRVPEGPDDTSYGYGMLLLPPPHSPAPER